MEPGLAVPLYITVLLVGGGVAIWLVGKAIANALGRDVTLTGHYLYLGCCAR